jgi:ParB family chromosome partitioning protein
VAEVAHRLCTSERLRRRRFELLPTTGPGAAFVEAQGRLPGDGTAPASLVELISSIATVGVLQPILIEEMADGSRRVVAGERRLRAVRFGAVNHPDNPHFQSVPAVVCPGPLSEAERRTWQLVENLAREDLQSGELAAALLYERSAVLVAKLLAAGVPVPEAAATLEDPVARFRALDRLRVQAGMHSVGAPWPEVLHRLGIQMREATARQLVRAFAGMPAELSSDMDAAKIALATRLAFLRLSRGRADAAAGLWAAVRARQRPELLGAAVREQLEHPDLDADEAIERANELRSEADRARARALRADVGEAGAGDVGEQGERVVDAQVVAGALAALRHLVGELRNGGSLSRYDAGSLALFAAELLELVAERNQGAAA